MEAEPCHSAAGACAAITRPRSPRFWNVRPSLPRAVTYDLAKDRHHRLDPPVSSLNPHGRAAPTSQAQPPPPLGPTHFGSGSPPSPGSPELIGRFCPPRSRLATGGRLPRAQFQGANPRSVGSLRKQPAAAYYGGLVLPDPAASPQPGDCHHPAPVHWKKGAYANNLEFQAPHW